MSGTLNGEMLKSDDHQGGTYLKRSNHLITITHYTDLLSVLFGVGQHGGDVEHDLVLFERRVDRVGSGLVLPHVQAAPETESSYQKYAPLADTDIKCRGYKRMDPRVGVCQFLVSCG